MLHLIKKYLKNAIIIHVRLKMAYSLATGYSLLTHLFKQIVYHDKESNKYYMHIELKYHDTTTKKEDIDLSIMIQIKKRRYPPILSLHLRSSFSTPTFYFLLCSHYFIT